MQLPSRNSKITLSPDSESISIWARSSHAVVTAGLAHVTPQLPPTGAIVEVALIPTTHHVRSNNRSTSISMPSAISSNAASQSSSSSAASQPASKRPLEITAPSVTLQPAGLSVDTLRYTATTKLQFLVAAGTGPTGAAFYYLTAASRLTGAVPASVSRSNCSSLAPPSSRSAWIDRFTASESPASRPSITFRCWCRPG